ncbi:MAG: hypothetical protein A2621_00680 [Alphaproteobacteria bacterium RIFCSPHIGHO2_01_FULL_41_14]|nr:MAG: hypothetical protein A2065_03090 [Alphaproteobacteria bacterium GWB1_45_5]OFW76298.1 MAG: hypothetical protein A3K20_02110 [Alphaproteobacteria bacterium GWA1_45_9]OFW89430.1 MAG: hypothetical protein A2621_00680 [Alphaproteobacteria bacterium RIFCSPHIGHO2_01_FULL_41_14]HCI48672.1 hypothetical protein [Holosporales bacterium]
MSLAAPDHNTFRPYGGLGLNADFVNPHFKTTVYNTAHAPVDDINAYYFLSSPRLFLGAENPTFFGSFGGVRVQGDLFLHNFSIQEDSMHGGHATFAILKINFESTVSLAGQVTKKISDQMEGYLGVRFLGTWMTSLYVASNVLRAPVLSEDQLLPGISPHVGLIYSVSDKLFCYLEGYISYYRTIERLGSESAAVTSPGATTIRITPTWAGVGVGVGWRF